MKVLFYISSMGGGGAQRVLWSLANYLNSNLGFDVSVATNLSESIAYPFDDNINLIDLERGINNKKGISHYIHSIISIKKIYKEVVPDLVISFQRGMNGMVLSSLLCTKAKIICSEHNHYLRKYGVVEDTMKKLFYWRSNAVTVLTRHDLKICKDQKKSNVVYMPNPLRQIMVNSTIRNKVVLAAGVVDRWETKGFDLLIKAWGKICHKHPEWILQIAGKGSAESMDYLRNIAQCNNCINVEFLGFRTDISTIMQESAVFALSSRFEGLPMALLEAMQAGCCCVSFDCETGPNEIIRDETDGLLVPALDVDKFSAALDKVMSDQTMRENFSSQAQKSILDKYSEYYVMDRWKILFSKLTSKK